MQKLIFIGAVKNQISKDRLFYHGNMLLIVYLARVGRAVKRLKGSDLVDGLVRFFKPIRNNNFKTFRSTCL